MACASGGDDGGGDDNGEVLVIGTRSGGGGGGGGGSTIACGDDGSWTPSPTFHEQSLEREETHFFFSNDS